MRERGREGERERDVFGEGYFAKPNGEEFDSVFCGDGFPHSMCAVNTKLRLSTANEEMRKLRSRERERERERLGERLRERERDWERD